MTSPTYQQLSVRQRDDLVYMQSLTAPRTPVTLNLADDIQHRFLLWQLESAGQTPRRSPQLFEALANARHYHQTYGPPTLQTLLQLGINSNTWVDTNMLVSLGDTGQTDFSSTALSAIVGGTITTQMVLNLYDLTTITQIGGNSNVSFGHGEYQVITTTGNAASADDDIQACYTCIYQKQGQPITVQTIYSSPEGVPKHPPHVTNPAHREGVTHPADYILVCLNRTQGQQPDCDYWYSNQGPDTIQLQVSGWVQFNDEILTPLTNENFFGSLYLVRRTQDGGGYKWLEGVSYLPFMTVSSTELPNDTLKWDFGTAQFGLFSPWESGDTIDLLLQLAVKTKNQPDSFSSMTVTSIQDAVPDGSVTVIDPLQFVNSCLASGTMIRMADGSSVPIESITLRGGHVLADRSGRTLLISSNVVHTRTIPLLLLRTDQGHTIRITPEHPLVTPEGIVVAQTLKPGDQVLTYDGPATLIEVLSEAYDGLTYNLYLHEDGREDVAMSGNHTTMFANDFLVGDYRMQQVHYAAWRARKEEILTRIPPEWHEDYLNSLVS